MVAKIISGKEIAKSIRDELKSKVEELKAKGITSGLSVVLVGEDPASQVYVKMKGKACDKMGIHEDTYKLPAETSEEELVKLIEKLNNDEKTHGILGRSNIVGKPVAGILMQKKPGANATVTIAHSRTKNLAEVTRCADILVAAIGKPEFIKADMVKDGVVIIDVGVNQVGMTSEGKRILKGDVDFESVKENQGYRLRA